MFALWESVIKLPQEIPQCEFDKRIRRVGQELESRELDALFAFSTESEPANVRYLSDYWPSFETAAVIVPVEGEPILVIGPESKTYAASRSKIASIYQILEFRETSEPEYPGVQLSSFEKIFDELSDDGVERLGIAGLNTLPASVYERLIEAMKGKEVVKADDILMKMRMIKTENELKLLREAYAITERAIERTLDSVKLGMTEIQITAEATYSMLSQGAESIAYPFWCISGPNTSQAISRPTHKKVRAGELIQLCIGARVGGYASSIGRPFVIGFIPPKLKQLMKTGLETEEQTIQIMKAGVEADSIAKNIARFVSNRGYREFLLYGPAHGTGLMECEPPFIETSSQFKLQTDIVFSVDTFLGDNSMGIRFEDGVRITESGVEELSSARRELISL